jgi:chaperone required for assembly of F1-ATPase
VKRFWTEAEARRDGDRFAILLDGKPMRLPGGPALRVRSAALADALAAEWRRAGGGAPGGTVGALDLPLTQLAGTAQERIAPAPGPVIDALSRYGETDLLCYRAEAPEPLVRRQAAAWQPWLDWAALALDAPLVATAGVMHVAQDPAALRALHRAVARLDAAALAGLGVIVPVLGSLVLGLATAGGQLDAAEACALASLDERFQAELWGEDTEALKRRAAIDKEVAEAARFMALSAG